MSYWTSETLRERLPAEELISPFDDQKIQHCGYELAMGPEAFVTSSEPQKKIVLGNGGDVTIPPGQFALLLTEERVKVPLNAIAFISMRFGWKRRGLINVSGFHVDPGFHGRLKFSVYNAGSNRITIKQGDRVFLIWYADLDGTEKVGYGDPGPDQDVISSDDQNVMHGEIASPEELKSQINDLKHSLNNIKLVLTMFVTIAIGIGMRLLFMDYFAVPDSGDIQRLRNDIMTEVRQELSEFERRNNAALTPTAAEAGGAMDDRSARPHDEGHDTATSGG